MFSILLLIPHAVVRHFHILGTCVQVFGAVHCWIISEFTIEWWHWQAAQCHEI